jgi:hypothetical protein
VERLKARGRRADQEGVDAQIDRGGTGAQRPWVGRRRALTVSAALGLVFVLLASAVFTIAARSRDVANRSVELHSLNEALRAATVVRAQATFAAYLAQSDRVFGTNSRAAIRVAVREARENLTELESARSASRSERILDQTTASALTRFTRSADRTLEAATGDRPTPAPRLVRDSLVPSFNLFRVRLESQRDQALTEVKHAGSVLGRLGGLASFVITFILPTIALLVYRQITRRSRESVELATALARERGRAARLRQLLGQSLSGLRRDVAELSDAEGDARVPALTRLGWDVEALIAVVAGTRRLAFADVRLADLLGEVAESLRDAGTDVGVTAAADGVWTDPSALGAAIRNLALEARDSGARRIRIDASVDGEDAEIRVGHDGAALMPAVASLVFERSRDVERAAVEAGAAPVRLLAAQELLEALGGSLGHVAGPGGPAFVALLPRTATRDRRPDADVGEPFVPVRA